MSARFEIVRTDAGWHARFRAKNSRIVWVTESYKRRGAAVQAIQLIAGNIIRESPFAAHPEIAWVGNYDEPTEVRDVDERGQS